MSRWTHIITEAYCMYDTLSKKTWKVTECDIKNLLRESKKWKIIQNRNYICPKRRLMWCRMHNKKRLPQFECLMGGNNAICPFLALSNCEPKEYREFNKAWKRLSSLEAKKEELI